MSSESFKLIDGFHHGADIVIAHLRMTRNGQTSGRVLFRVLKSPRIGFYSLARLLMVGGDRIVAESGYPSFAEVRRKPFPLVAADHEQVKYMAIVFQGPGHCTNEGIVYSAEVSFSNLSASFGESVKPAEANGKDGGLHFVQATVQSRLWMMVSL
jgi:hypothetical protein